MKRLASILALVTACALPACDTDGGDAHVTVAGDAQLVILITDAPLDISLVRSVIVTIGSVAVYPTMLTGEGGSSPLVMIDHPVTLDLLTLTDGATALLAQASLPTGFFERIRLEIVDARLIFLDGTELDLSIGFVNVDISVSFELTLDAVVEIVLDFDAQASIQVNLSSSEPYVLEPVVTVISVG